MAAGRPTVLNDPEQCLKIAELLHGGASRAEVAEVYGVKESTVTNWRKDPRIAGPLKKLMENRILHITTKVDSQIAARLQHADQLTVRELLEIRKEFLGGALRQQTEKADESTLTEAMEALEKNPALIEQLHAVLRGKPQPPSAEELDAMVNGDGD